MKMRNMIATMTAVAFSAISCVAMSASAAVTEIPYNGPGAGALATQDDGKGLRLNIYNTWGNQVTDINNAVAVVDNITVTFTVSGIGTDSCNFNEDGSAGDAFYAYIAGSVAGTNVFDPGSNGNATIPITGDGEYTVTWDLPSDAESVELLLIGTNINIYQYGEGLDASGLNITVNKITTGVEDAPTEAPTEAPTTEAPAETTAAPATTTAAGTTAAGSTTAATTTTAASSTTTNANTGDNGIAIALAALGTAGAVAIVSRKRK